MKNIKVWPHLTIVAILCALLAGLGVALWMMHERKVSAEALPNAARIQRVDGEVAISNGLAATTGNQASDSTYNEAYRRGDNTAETWIKAEANQPFSVGDRIYARENSRASLAFSGRNFARLHPNTSLDVLALSDDRTQLALREGSAMFDVGYLAPGQLFEVATPYGAVDFNEPGLYSVDIDNGSAIISVLSGLAQVVGLAGSGQISKGEVLTLVGATAANVVLSPIDRRNAGNLVDDYYSYQYPNYYDGRYRDYDVYLSDPYYFDPYRHSVSYRYVSNIIPGFYDLDYYGDWMNLSGYGYAWRPRVVSGWAPYQAGYWINDYPYGLTWVSTEPWGYAPYHYGRWAFSGDQWYWIPDAVNTTPLYSPALVAFIPISNDIGWVPLGPGDPYAPRYYDVNWQPYYLTRTELVQTRLLNLAVPGAVIVVPVDQFGRVIDGSRIIRANPQMLAQVRPVLDPLLLTPLRNAVIHSAWGRGKIDLPPGIAKKLSETSVITSVAPFAPPFGKDLARTMRVEPVPEKVKNQKLKINDKRHGEEASSQQVPAPPAEAARGNREARQQMRQLEQQQRQQQIEQQRIQRRAEQQAQGERVGGRVKVRPQREVPQPRRPEVKHQPSRRPLHQPPKRQQPMRPQLAPKAVERQPAPVPSQQQPRVERKQGPPAAAAPNAQGPAGKGKGRRP
jgi:hypothetical protein